MATLDRTKKGTESGERMWRDKELVFVASQEGVWKWAYTTEVSAYMKELAEYPDAEGFPHTERPLRPVTDKGNPIILEGRK